MQVTCRRQDIPVFDALGFHLDFEQAPDCPIVELIDEEANYAHADQLPTDLPFTAWHGAGGNYGDGKIACDGNHYAEVSANQDGFVVRWDEASSQPTQESLAGIRDYLAVRQTVQEMFHTLSARPTPTAASHA
jgi:hypothetical protein